MDNSNINIVNEVLFFEKNIQFTVNSMKKQLLYIKRHTNGNLISIN